MGKKSRDKGASFEREIVNLLQELGVAAERVPLSGAAGGSFCGDISCPVRGEDKRLECKRRARAFSTIYGFLNGSFAAVVRDDRCPPLVVMRIEDFAELIR